MPPQAGNEYHALGAVVPPERLPSFQFTIEDGTGPLRRRTLVAPGGRKVASGWYDPAAQAPCAAVTVGGKLHCAPLASFAGYYFSDAACTTPLYHAATACPPATAYGYDATVCPFVVRYYKVGAAYMGPVFTQTVATGMNAGTLQCGSYTPTGGDSFYQMTALDPSTFPELQAVDPTP
jgi:hypothetical protein